jgi:flagellar basal-body rod protein FlgG
MEVIFKSGLEGTVESGLLLEKKMDLTANNLANVATAGFKRDRISFRELLLTAYNGEIKQAKTESIYTDFGPGEVKRTGNPLDAALNGPGFFKIETPDGILYTRAGNFALNGDNVLVTAQGYPVMGQGGPITLDGTTIEINEVGGISMDQAGDGVMAEADSLAVVNFDDPSVLEKLGNSLYRLKDPRASEIPADGTQVRQGYLEQSNVNVMEEMVQMIQVQRNYESYQKIIQLLDEIDSRAINDVGKLT